MQLPQILITTFSCRVNTDLEKKNSVCSRFPLASVQRLKLGSDNMDGGGRDK